MYKQSLFIVKCRWCGSEFDAYQVIEVKSNMSGGYVVPSAIIRCPHCNQEDEIEGECESFDSSIQR